MTTRLRTNNLTLAYGADPVLNGLSVDIPDNQITAVVGPNACGKSTLLKCMARLLKPKSGEVLLDGTPVHRQNTKSVAKTIALLPQSTETPDGMRVTDLVARGRTPHQTPLQQWSERDEVIVKNAIDRVGLSKHAQAEVKTLSGGQSQRAWIAMVMAQDTDIMLLDEPTTYLDLRYQIDTLKLVQELQKERGLTVVMVLHDINLAARFASHIIALRDGGVVCEGRPQAVISEANIAAIYDLSAHVLTGPVDGVPYVIPL